MLTEQEQKFDEILQDIAETLDILPSKYKQAVDRYSAVGKHLEKGSYPRVITFPKIYVQGSFRLGTVVRPVKNDKEADYDIDLVCQMPIAKENTTAKDLKHMVGDRLKENADYERILDRQEGCRCWTLEYAEEEDGIGFHMDILPSVPMDDSGRRVLKERVPNAEYYKHAIEITDLDRKTQKYSWPVGGSNPEGFAQWFDNIKMCYSDYRGLSTRQKQAIYENTRDKNNRLIFASVNDVPEPLVRTPLQQAIQILKHHRDVYFKNDSDNKPISMIITTLCARFYAREQDVFTALINIIQKISDFAQYIRPSFKFSENVRESQSMIDSVHGYNPIIDKPIYKLNGKWWIPNPVNPAENFADRWDNEIAKAFFEWLGKLKQNFDLALQQKGLDKIANVLRPILGDRVVTNAFIKTAERKRAGLNNKTIKTTLLTGILSTKGNTNNIKHTFHC
jgi:hypothetical protein